MITNQNFSILINRCATKSFISSASLKRIKVNEVKKDKFRYIEMESNAKKNVGGKVMDCSIILGYFLKKDNLYVMILGYYGRVIGMDSLESHDAILNCKTKQLSLIDDLVHGRVIVGRN
jgi:hypothetical protein